MGDIYTSGIWTIKEGREDDFVAAWAELVETAKQLEGARDFKLMKSLEKPNRYISIGGWDSAEAQSAWRASPEFAERMSRLKDCIESLDSSAYEVVSKVGVWPRIPLS